MAIKINNDTVIDDSQKGEFQVLNPGSFTEDPVDGELGNFYYDSTDGKVRAYNGSRWK